MPKFSINVSMMLKEYDFLDRFAAAADLGFAGVDIQFPYDHEADAVAARASAAGVEVVLINLPAADLTAGGNGLACVPGAEAEFGRAIDTARIYARALGARRVNVLPGRLPDEVGKDDARRTLIANLRRAADAFANDGVTVMMEPCNTRDVPRFLVSRMDDAIAILDEADRPNLALQFDFYHRQIMDGDLIDGFNTCLPRIGHVQFADVPGRHEPGTGEISFANIFAAVDASGYEGWVGAEYLPTGTTAASLGWLR